LTIKFDPHVHSKHSYDGVLSPQRILKIAKQRALDAIAITDHNTIKGGLQAKSIKQDNILIIVGSEVNTDYGDVIGLFLNEELKSQRFEELIDEIRDQGGNSVLPHPYRRKRFPGNKLIKTVDIIEGINGRTSVELNVKAQDLAKELKKPIIAGSDAHISFELGRVWNLAGSMSNCNEDDLRKIILEGKFETGGITSPLLQKISIISGAAIKRLKG